MSTETRNRVTLILLAVFYACGSVAGWFISAAAGFAGVAVSSVLTLVLLNLGDDDE